MKKLFTYLVLGILVFNCSSDDSNPGPVLSDCDKFAKVVTENQYNQISTESYTITDVSIDEDCLSITLSSSGCDGSTWIMDVYSDNVFFDSDPLQRRVKVGLNNPEDCLAIVTKTVSFDLKQYRLAGQNQVPLKIEGWEGTVVYTY